MKMESEVIIEFLKNIRYMISQITEAVKVGDDGFKEFIQEQEAEINNAINHFTILNLTPVTKKKEGLGYVKFWEEDLQRRDGQPKEMTATENTYIYKGGLYHHIKKTLGQMKGDDLASVPNDELYNWIEYHTILNGSQYEKMIGTNEWYQASFNVVQDVANEIIEQRKKSPQQNLFS